MAKNGVNMRIAGFFCFYYCQLSSFLTDEEENEK